MSIDFNQLREFLVAIAQTDITELTLKNENFELVVRKGAMLVSSVPIVEKTEVIVPPPTTVAAKPMGTPSITNEIPTSNPLDKKWVEITSPMVGTFYRSPGPGEAPFVEVSDRIRVGQGVCIIEAMKLMNEIEAEVAGQIMEIAVDNGQPVEYGQTLMWVNPD